MHLRVDNFYISRNYLPSERSVIKLNMYIPQREERKHSQWSPFENLQNYCSISKIDIRFQKTIRESFFLKSQDTFSSGCVGLLMNWWTVTRYQFFFLIYKHVHKLDKLIINVVSNVVFGYFRGLF